MNFNIGVLDTRLKSAKGNACMGVFYDHVNPLSLYFITGNLIQVKPSFTRFIFNASFHSVLLIQQVLIQRILWAWFSKQIWINGNFSSISYNRAKFPVNILSILSLNERFKRVHCTMFLAVFASRDKNNVLGKAGKIVT